MPVNTPATRNANLSDSNYSDSNRPFMGGSTEQQARSYRPINAIPSPRTDGSASGRRRSYRRWSLAMGFSAGAGPSASPELQRRS
eukprot:scaffold70931_cov19-Phaeocystis_antarctica.AAC.1